MVRGRIMSGKITDLSAIGSIDRTADLLEIVDISANASFKVTVNNLVGITGGGVVSTTDTQNLQYKTLDNTNILTVKAGNLVVQDTSDITKQLALSLASITTSTTRTVTFPDASGTLVLTAATQTLTNKTLTSPTITGGSIDNTTVTVDSVAGHTSASTGTVYGISVTSGTVGAAALATGAVTATKIGTDSSFASTSYTPTITNFTTGNGSVAGSYYQLGKTVFGRAQFTMGSTSSVGGAVTISLPVTSVAYTADREFLGGGVAYDDSATSAFPVVALWSSTTTLKVWNQDASATSLKNVAMSSSLPMTWATSDTLTAQFRYEAA
jgi:hypothetical protein